MKNSGPPYTMHRSSRFLAICILLSLLGHAFASVILERFGTFNFGAAITQPAVVMVDLTSPKQKPYKKQIATNVSPLKKPAKPSLSSNVPVAPAASMQPLVHAIAKPEADQAPAKPQPAVQPSAAQAPAAAPPQPALAPPEDIFVKGDSIVAVQQEKLVYQLSLSGVPVGSAQLEASNTNGELRIQSTIRSNSVMSAIYSVNDSTDTRLIKGRYLLTRIKQNEGLFKSDTGFTIMYPDRKIFWVDRLKKRYSNEPLESLDTLDFVSGFYFMRQKSLKIGDSFPLKLYDGDTTTTVPVIVLRREKLPLPGMRSADTLVVQPAFAESGFFRNNRELLIWFTNDENRVPVRFEATTPIGRVVAELVSSERIMQPVSHSEK